MSITGKDVSITTPAGDHEYAPTMTPDGTAFIVGRRDAEGHDLGYWSYRLAGGEDPRQITSDGAPPVGSDSLTGVGLTGEPGLPVWAGRTAFDASGSMMLTVRGSDNVIELVDLSGAKTALELGMIGNSRPIYIASTGSFLVTGSTDSGATWSLWEVRSDGSTSRIGPSSGDLSEVEGGELAVLIKDSDGASHLAVESRPGATPFLLATEPSLSEASPSFSPDGSALVFGRVSTANPTISAGVWTVRRDGTQLICLSTDGAFPRWVV
jgi:hypothetical protein